MSIERGEGRRFTPTTMFICGGLLIWAADFLLMYVVAAIACARQFASLAVLGLPFVAMFGTALTAVSILAIVWLVRVAVRRLRAEHASDRAVRFIYFLAASIGSFSIVAVVFNALPAWLLATECGR